MLDEIKDNIMEGTVNGFEILDNISEKFVLFLDFIGFISD